MPRPGLGLAVVLALVAAAGAFLRAHRRFGVIEGAGAGIRTPPADFNDGCVDPSGSHR